MSTHAEETYLSALRKILVEGEERDDRTGTGTLSLFGLHLDFGDVSTAFPLLTTKRVFWRGVVAELLWFIGGHTNVELLHKHGVHIWDSWANENGFLGPVYGAQWRSWKAGEWDERDQLDDVIQEIKKNPTSRRLLVNSWNVGEVPDMALPPCHYAFQFYVSKDNKLSLMWQQRSADMFLGVPFNMASYALLLHIVARITGLGVGSLKCTLGDAHIYKNHLRQVTTQLERPVRDAPFLKLPDWAKPNAKNLNIINDFDLEFVDPKEFILVGYDPYPAIKAPISK